MQEGKLEWKGKDVDNNVRSKIDFKCFKLLWQCHACPNCQKEHRIIETGKGYMEGKGMVINIHKVNIEYLE